MTNNDSSRNSLIGCASLEFDLELGVIQNLRGDSQRLSPVNLKLLAYLLKHQGQVVSRTELFDAVWPNQLISDDVLTRAVSDIRAQLTKLDADNKFIETLPKRGYRWAVDLKSIESPEINLDEPDVAPQLLTVATKNNWLKQLLMFVSLAVALALIMMWAISAFLSSQAINVAVLPTIAERAALQPSAHLVDDALLKVLRKNTRVKLLSAAAIKSSPQNPFPYFANEFGATWVIESRLSDIDGVNTIELSLVDARSGIEVRNLKFDVVNRADISQKVAQKLELDLLVEHLPY